MTENTNKSITLYVCDVDSDWEKPKLYETPAWATDRHYVLGWDLDDWEAMRGFANHRVISKSEALTKGYRETKREAIEAAIHYVTERKEILSRINEGWDRKSYQLGELYLSLKE